MDRPSTESCLNCGAPLEPTSLPVVGRAAKCIHCGSVFDLPEKTREEVEEREEAVTGEDGGATRRTIRTRRFEATYQGSGAVPKLPERARPDAEADLPAGARVVSRSPHPSTRREFTITATTLEEYASKLREQGLDEGQIAWELGRFDAKDFWPTVELSTTDGRGAWGMAAGECFDVQGAPAEVEARLLAHLRAGKLRVERGAERTVVFHGGSRPLARLLPAWLTKSRWLPWRGEVRQLAAGHGEVRLYVCVEEAIGPDQFFMEDGLRGRYAALFAETIARLRRALA